MVEDTRSVDRAAMIVLGIGMAFIVFPLAVTVITASQSYEDFARSGLSFRPGGHLLDNLRGVFEQTQLPRQVLNSIVVAFIVGAGKCILAFLTAFAIVYFRIRYGTVIFALVLATIMLPIDLRIITTYQVAANLLMPVDALLDLIGIDALATAWLGAPLELRLNVLDTYVGLALPLLAHGTGTFLFRQFFKSLPADLVKAARMDGAGPLRFMIDILLPLSKASFVALFILMFLGGWTQYLWPLVAASTPDMQTAVVGLARLRPSDDSQLPDFPLIMAGALLVSIIPLTVIACLQHHIVRGLTLTEK